jgi:anti-sigma regulatory factor (Ser/Thr protein kinase)
MGERIELLIPSRLESLDLVASVLGVALKKGGFDDDAAWKIELAVWEAVSNAIQHGHGNREQRPV